MAPSKDPSPFQENQPRRRVPHRRTRRPRSRRCLLKGCGRKFRPQQPLARYCSGACREEARQWRARKARRRYRQAAHGKQKRHAQSRRYRERRKGRQEPKTVSDRAARVIPIKFFSCCCDRPGCYEEFDRTRRSPLQRFCSHACRHALVRVLERERRWRERRLEPEQVQNVPGAWRPLRG